MKALRHTRPVVLLVVVASLLLVPWPCERASAADLRGLVKSLSSDDAVARFAAEEQLIEAQDAAVDALEPLATSRGHDLPRLQAVNIIAQIATPKARTLLLHILESEPDIRARGLVCMHLGRLGVEEAVPLIGKWLRTICGKPIAQTRHPVVLSETYEWMRHADALREIGSEKGIPILEDMIRAGHGGPGGQALVRTYRESLFELQREQTFRKAARSVPGVEAEVDALFAFFRGDTLARTRLYRMKLVALGTEGRWVLEDLKRHPDEKIRRAAAAVLAAWPRLQKHRGTPT